MPDKPEEAAAVPSTRVRGTHLQSLEKGLAVMAAFDPRRMWLSAPEIAERAGLDRASARRVLMTLVELGHVRRSGRGFGLTAKVLDFGHRYLSALPFASVAHPVLEELSDQIGETVSIGVLDGADVVFVLRVPSKRLLTFDPGVGARVPAHLHSIGHVLLAAREPVEQEAFVGRVRFERVTPDSIQEPEPLRRALALARAQGWALTQQQYELNHGGISVPLNAASGEAIAAINVSFIVDRDSELRAVNDILPRLRLAARKISSALG